MEWKDEMSVMTKKSLTASPYLTVRTAVRHRKLPRDSVVRHAPTHHVIRCSLLRLRLVVVSDTVMAGGSPLHFEIAIKSYCLAIAMPNEN